jgi:hypothetical protein
LRDSPKRSGRNERGAGLARAFICSAHAGCHGKLRELWAALVLDKSFLQSISADESVWFDHFFMPIVRPVLYVESRGNLANRAASTPIS